MNELDAQRRDLRRRVRRVNAHGRETPAEVLRRAADWCEEHDLEFDHYGTGSAIEDFERRVAELLGYPAARFMPSGKVAQNVAMRVRAERSGCAHFGMHPTCHLELHESRAYAYLYGLYGTLVGATDRPILASDVRAVKERLAALIVELPAREIGGQLPKWDELQELVSVARERGIWLHMDGARVWEAAASYERPLTEVCAGFDSVYVSFYKGIGALSGAMLLGDEAFIEESALWQRRAGATLYTLVPNVASAAMLLEDRLARMPRYVQRARAMASLVNEVDRVRTRPRVPHVNMMHVYLTAEIDHVLAARDRLAEEADIWLVDGLTASEVPGTCKFEWTIGDAALGLDPGEIGGLYARLVELIEEAEGTR